MPLINCKTISVWMFRLIFADLIKHINAVHVWHFTCAHYLDVQWIKQLLESAWATVGTKRWNSDVPCAWRKAASDVFLDGLNNECLKRVLGPQLPNLPLSSALTCSSGTRLEKEGKEECVSTSAEATCCLRHRLSLGIAKDHKHVTSGLRLTAF